MNNNSIAPHDNIITPIKDSLPSRDINSQLKEVIVERIPIHAEEFEVMKEVTETKLYLEKRWIKSTKKIEVPINYEEMFINGKEFDSYSHNELVEIFSKVKEKISEVFNPNQTEVDANQPYKGESGDNRHYPNDLDIKLQKDEDTTKTTLSPTEKENESSQREKKPLLPNSEDSTINSQIQVSDINTNNNGSEEEEQIIPIWGEQIVIDKKMVKLGEIAIKKSRIVEKRQVNVEVRKEKVTVKYPDGKKEEIT
jgi:stress response protein YsnF